MIMKCLVFLPDNSAIEVIIHSKALGQECLEKVCDFLNIIETRFFGLQFIKSGEFCWLILQKRIDQQVTLRLRTTRLFFKVKFYVSPHHIQQNSTRHQYYLNICNYLENRGLRIDSEKRIKLIALIAQIEFGDYDGESFDLKILYTKWIRILFRNNRRISSRSSDSKYKLRCDYLEQQINNSNIVVRSKTCEHCDILRQIIFCHQRFIRYTTHRAKNIFLIEALEIQEIGVDHFTVTSNKESCIVGIGPRGLAINSNNNSKLITYNKLKDIHFRRSNQILNYNFIITISFSDENNSIIEQKFCLFSKKDACFFYRLLAEKRVFYSFPMVEQSMVTTRYTSNYTILNDLVNTISSNSLKAGKKNKKPKNNKPYVFDVDRTLKQFYDDIRRFIFHYNNQFDRQPVMLLDYRKSDNRTGSCIEQEKEDPSKCICKICRDDQIIMAFIPCGHTCCDNCCQNIKTDVCPFCKSDIKTRQKIFI